MTAYDQFHCLSQANCYSAHESLGLGFPVLLRFCDARSGRAFHPLYRYPGPLARTRRRPLRSRGITSPQTQTPDRESLPATIAESIRVKQHPCRLDGPLGASNSPAPFCNCTESRSDARYNVMDTEADLWTVFKKVDSPVGWC